jgi:hypothetical protein
MNILVNHTITNPDAYWGALGANPAVPEGFKVLIFMAGDDPSASACLWSAPDVSALSTLVEKTVGHASTNSYMVINDTKSFGL